VTVTVRNIAKKVRRIKFSQPKTSKFKCDYDIQGPVAAGLAVKINVSFESDVEGDFHDYIEITTEDPKNWDEGSKFYEEETFQLKLHALKPGPDIQFEPLVNFKFVPVNQIRTEEIIFKNEGRVPGNVQLKYDAGKNGELEVYEPQFTLQPEEQKAIEVALKP